MDDSVGAKPYQRVDSLEWTETEKQHGKVIKIKGFPAEHKVKVFRVVLSTQRTDYVVTNEMAQDNVEVVHDVCGFRWKVEQFHRETKQLTGIEGNQCRKARSVRNHIGCAILVWVRLKQVAVETQRTIYRVKHDLLDDYLRQQLKSPGVQMRLALLTSYFSLPPLTSSPASPSHPSPCYTNSPPSNRSASSTAL